MNGDIPTPVYSCVDVMEGKDRQLAVVFSPLCTAQKKYKATLKVCIALAA